MLKRRQIWKHVCMSIRFAAPNTPGRFSVAAPSVRPMVRRASHQTANDNGEGAQSDTMLRAALRHFAEHGLGAAREARLEAEKAFFAGDRSRYDWWMSVTRTLDRRMAAEAEQQLPKQGTP
ncbi:hypothetical protein N9D37_00300 [Erythrobacter sp.]|nr:hypothetical protein [Erythrobacter sp.]